MSENISKAIVLSIYQIEENGFLVSFFNEKGCFELFANGLNKISSKNRANLQIGSIVEIEYFPARLKQRVGKLKKAHLIETLDLIQEKNAKFAKKIALLLKNIRVNNHMFLWYTKIFHLINETNVAKLLTFFYAHSLIFFGIEPVFNACRICKSRKNLIDFEVSDGGFLCDLHDKSQTKSLNFLTAVWYSFNDLKKYLITTNQETNYQLFRYYQSVIKNAGYII
ncbi:DNA repair protein RecO [Mycoplasma leonicaptivi]|uniref:DNA repair protein RecO n=1 Tax=Mycoplasma leonicaptivi TaxID=36742 RepID=UPI000482A522|nr:DNA repair protein RecO [Mycoplasma leonicaptivi]